MFREHNINFEDIATPLAYQRNPDLAYWFYGHRLVQYRNAVPHEGYQILKSWAGAKSHGYFVFTSNVDGYFQNNPQDVGVPKMHLLSLEMTALTALKAIDELL